MRVAERYFLVEDATERLVPVPAARMERWYRGTELAAEHAGRVVRVLDVICVSEGRRVRRIERVQPRTLRFLADGRLDRDRQLGFAGERARIVMGPGEDVKRRAVAALRELDERQGFAMKKEHLRALNEALLGPRRR